MDTKYIQKSIYFQCKRRQQAFMVSNKYLNKWFECDFISISKSDYLTEYEIKISKSDFKRDFIEKPIKHAWLDGRRTGEVITEDYIIVDKPSPPKDDPPYVARRYHKMDPFHGPNYFYYVCPENLIKIEEIPKYAGLIYIIENKTNVGKLQYIKKAPLLHKIKTTEETKNGINVRYMYDYWKHTYEQK